MPHPKLMTITQHSTLKTLNSGPCLFDLIHYSAFSAAKVM